MRATESSSAHTILLPRATGVLRIRVAKGYLDRVLGLLGRAELPAHEGLLLTPCNGIHTFGMRFAIDVVFLSRHGKIMAIHARVPAWRCLHCAGAGAALELGAGVARQAGLQSDDELPQLAVRAMP